MYDQFVTSEMLEILCDVVFCNDDIDLDFKDSEYFYICC